MRLTADAGLRRLLEFRYAIQEELDAASNARVGTVWWSDRISQLKRLTVQIDFLSQEERRGGLSGLAEREG